MGKSINDNRKIGRGRPPTGTAPMVGVRMTEELQDQVRAWARKQESDPPLATAIRQLVEIGLGRAFQSERPAPAKTRAASADRAKELAEKTIERVVDPSIPPEEKVVRRRRLVKGPSEFREDRVDQPRPKKR